jgi:hypothetical protein
MIKLIWKILTDHRGWDTGSMASGAASGAMTGSSLGLGGAVGGAVLGGVLGAMSKNKKEEDIYDPYAAQRAQYASYLSGKLGTATPDKYAISQPGIEKQAEGVISGYLGNPTTNVSDYSAATKQYSDAAKASREQTYANEMKKTQDMYNRLGLVSSTPGLTAQGDLNRAQATESNLFDTELQYQNLDRQLQAQGMDVNQLSSMLGLGTNLGQTQRGAQEYGLTQALAENQGYSNQMGSLLGQIDPERTVSYTPNTANQLLSLLQNKDTSTMLSKLR